MVVIEIKSFGQRFTINEGRIVDGDIDHSAIIRKLSQIVGGHLEDGDPDYCIAQEFVALYGGRILEHQDTDCDPDSIE